MIFNTKYTLLLFFLIVDFQNINAQNSVAHEYVDLEPTDFYLVMNESKDGILIDCRSTLEFKRSRIKESKLAQKKEILKEVVDTLDRETPIFVYCRTDDRSKAVCKILTTEFNFTKVYNLKGGIVAWRKEGYEIDQSRLSD